jgi:hypothetical protein
MSVLPSAYAREIGIRGVHAVRSVQKLDAIASADSRTINGRNSRDDFWFADCDFPPVIRVYLIFSYGQYSALPR